MAYLHWQCFVATVGQYFLLNDNHDNNKWCLDSGHSNVCFEFWRMQLSAACNGTEPLATADILCTQRADSHWSFFSNLPIKGHHEDRRDRLQSILFRSRQSDMGWPFISWWHPSDVIYKILRICLLILWWDVLQHSCYEKSWLLQDGVVNVSCNCDNSLSNRKKAKSCLLSCMLFCFNSKSTQFEWTCLTHSIKSCFRISCAIVTCARVCFHYLGLKFILQIHLFRSKIVQCIWKLHVFKSGRQQHAQVRSSASEVSLITSTDQSS